MKRFLGIVSVVLAGQIYRRGVDTIHCPGQCWNMVDGVCVPQAGKVKVELVKMDTNVISD